MDTATELTWQRVDAKGLRHTDRHRFGCAACLVGHLVFVVGRIDGRLGDVLNTKTRKWSPLRKHPARPIVPVLCTVNLVDALIYVVGLQEQKYEQANTTLVRDTYTLDPLTCKWEMVATFGERPPVRKAHSTEFDERNRRLIVFGGQGRQKILLNDLYALDVDTSFWLELKPKGMPPIGREKHGSCLQGSLLWIYGGRLSFGTYLEDLHLLDLSRSVLAWEKIATINTPAGRCGAALADVGNGRLLVFGGYANQDTNELYQVNTMQALHGRSVSWELLNTAGSLPPRRERACAMATLNKLIVLGGSSLDASKYYELCPT